MRHECECVQRVACALYVVERFSELETLPMQSGGCRQVAVQRRQAASCTQRTDMCHCPLAACRAQWKARQESLESCPAFDEVPAYTP